MEYNSNWCSFSFGSWIQEAPRKGAISMNKTTLRFDADEATLLKLKSLSGANYFQNKDFQRIIQILINKTYDQSKGKVIK